MKFLHPPEIYQVISGDPIQPGRKISFSRIKAFNAFQRLEKSLADDVFCGFLVAHTEIDIAVNFVRVKIVERPELSQISINAIPD
jgi:hypothetical protein